MTSEFPEALSRQADFLSTPDLITALGSYSPSMVDAAQLRLKLETLCGRPSDSYSRITEPGSSRRSTKSRTHDCPSLTTLDKGIGTPLSVHSISGPLGPPCLPFQVATPQLPSPSSLPWLQLSGSHSSMPS